MLTTRFTETFGIELSQAAGTAGLTDEQRDALTGKGRHPHSTELYAKVAETWRGRSIQRDIIGRSYGL